MAAAELEALGAGGGLAEAAEEEEEVPPRAFRRSAAACAAARCSASFALAACGTDFIDTRHRLDFFSADTAHFELGRQEAKEEPRGALLGFAYSVSHQEPRVNVRSPRSRGGGRGGLPVR